MTGALVVGLLAGLVFVLFWLNAGRPRPGDDLGPNAWRPDDRPRRREKP